tara:strand:- start:3999 stop:4931 length:933 start_codon:yes stop_codon:yes gene_type:complete
MANIISGADFNVEADINFAAVKSLANGRKTIGVNNKHSKSSKVTYISTPLMLTWGINKFVDEATANESFDMALQFPQAEYITPEAAAFLKNMQMFEKSVKEKALENSKDWLGKPIKSMDAIEALWTPMLRYPKDRVTGETDYSRSPTLKIKIPRWEGEFKNIELYNEEQVQLFPNDDGIQPIDFVTKGSHVATIISCGGIWVAGSKFGVTWRLFQAVVKPPATLAGKCHINLSSKDKETLISLAVKAEAEADADEESVTHNTRVDTVVEDSDDDDDDVVVPVVESEEVKVVATEDTPKKKKIVKKKTTAS